MPTSIAEQIAAELGHAIMSRHFMPGEQIKEQSVAARFSVSRGPVRDALRLLERQGFVEISPRRGAYVADLILDDFIDVFNTRAMLLSLAVRYVARNPDKTPLVALQPSIETLRRLANEDAPPVIEFIAAMGRMGAGLVKASGSRQLLHAFRNLSHTMIWRMLWSSAPPLDFLSAQRRRTGMADYEEVFASILASDAERAERFMRKIMRESAAEVIGRMGTADGDRVSSYRLDVL